VTGVLVFRSRLDLAGVSVLVGYHIWAGVRALHLTSNGRGWRDLGPAMAVVSAGFAVCFLSAFAGLFYWSIPIVRAVGGAMAFYGGYDALRTLFPKSWRVWLNPAEHAFRMVSLTGALASVAVATLLRGYVLPVVAAVSLLASLAAFTFAVRAVRRALRQAEGDRPSTARKARLKADRLL